METKSAQAHSCWYKSYIKDVQGKCLITYYQNKVNSQSELIEIIKGELDMVNEYGSDMILESISALLKQHESLDNSTTLADYTWTD